MIAAMPKPRPPYISCEPSRHGTLRYYFRRGKGPRIRLPDISDPAFWAAYRKAAEEGSLRPATKAKGGTLEWLIQRYMDSAPWRALAPATRKQRSNLFKQVVGKSGTAQVGDVNRASIIKGIETRAATPAQARNFLDAMKGLFRWAVDVELATSDPTASVKTPPKTKGPGFAAWSEDDVAKYQRRWPIGTKERVWLEVLLNTGLRRGDAVQLGRQHIRDGEAVIVTEKTAIEVTIPLPDAFWTAVNAGPTGDLIFICGVSGRPLTKEVFGNRFREACNAADVKKSAHGLRKLAATRVAEAGASVAELESLFGWTGGRMASLYTETANRKRLARQAAERLRNANAPHLAGAAPHPAKKT